MTDTFLLNNIKIPPMSQMDHDHSDYTMHTDTESQNSSNYATTWSRKRYEATV